MTHRYWKPAMDIWSSEVGTSWHGSRARTTFETGLHEEYVITGSILLPSAVLCFDNQFLKRIRSVQAPFYL